MDFEFTPKFVKAEDYFQYTGLSINEELAESDDEGNDAKRFLYQVELRVMNFINGNGYVKVDFDNLSEYQTKQIRIAILEHARNCVTFGIEASLNPITKAILFAGGFLNIIRG